MSHDSKIGQESVIYYFLLFARPYNLPNLSTSVIIQLLMGVLKIAIKYELLYTSKKIRRFWEKNYKMSSYSFDFALMIIPCVSKIVKFFAFLVGWVGWLNPSHT